MAQPTPIPTHAARRAVIDSAKTIVVKVGTNVLSKDDDTLDLDRIEALCDQDRKSVV